MELSCTVLLAGLPPSSWLALNLLFIFWLTLSASFVRAVGLSSRLMQDTDKNQAWKIQPLAAVTPSKALASLHRAGGEEQD